MVLRSITVECTLSYFKLLTSTSLLYIQKHELGKHVNTVLVPYSDAGHPYSGRPMNLIRLILS